MQLQLKRSVLTISNHIQFKMFGHNPQFSEQICFVIWGVPIIIIIPDLIIFSGFTSDLINHLWRRQWLSITIVFNLSPPLHQHPSAQHKRFKSITMFPSKRNISHNNYNFKRFKCFRQNESFRTKNSISKDINQ